MFFHKKFSFNLDYKSHYSKFDFGYFIEITRIYELSYHQRGGAAFLRKLQNKNTNATVPVGK